MISEYDSKSWKRLYIKQEPNELVPDWSWSYGSIPAIYKPNGASLTGCSHITILPVGSEFFGNGNSVMSPVFCIFQIISPLTRVRVPTCLWFCNLVLVLILANCFCNSFFGNILPDNSVNASAGD